jgi:quinol monooxygenase YgiN
MSSAPPSRAGQVALYAEFTAKPGREEEVASLLAELTRKVRTEPGNLVFDPHRLESNPAEFFVYEVYADPAAFDAHITADYGATFNTALGYLIIGDGSELTWLRPLDLD